MEFDNFLATFGGTKMLRSESCILNKTFFSKSTTTFTSSPCCLTEYCTEDWLAECALCSISLCKVVILRENTEYYNIEVKVQSII